MKDAKPPSNSRIPFFVGLIIFILLISLTQYLAYQKHRIDKDRRREEMLRELYAVQDRIKKTLSYSLSATKTLAFIIEKYGVPKDFNSLAKEILRSNKNIDALELTSEGLITHVYPLEGNEAAIGLEILHNSATGKQAYQAIQKNDLYFAGPFELKQGGLGFVGRLPIYKDNKFFGFSVVIIRLSTLLKEAGIDTLENSRFVYQLSKVNSETHKEEFFLPGRVLPLGAQWASVGVNDGEWKLSIAEKDPGISFNALIISILGFFLSVLCYFLALSKLKQPAVLKQLVDKRTQQLAASERYFRTLIEKSSDAIVLLNADGDVLYQTSSAEKIHGHSVSELRSMERLEMLHPDDREEDARTFGELRSSPGITLHRSHRIKHKNGGYLWIEGRYTNLLEDENIKAIVYNYSDVTLRVESEQKAAIAKRLYEVISRINRVMVSVKSEDVLFTEVCRIAVEHGKFKMAWIGLVEDHKIRPVAWAGEENGYLDKTGPVYSQNIHESNEPSAKAVKTNGYVCCNTIEEHAKNMTWAKEALKRGYRSSVSFPIKIRETVIGTFSLYASTQDFFNEKEIELLKETTADISFSLNNFENETLRIKAEAEVLNVYKDKEITLNRIKDSVISVDTAWRYTYLNEPALSEHKTSLGEILGRVIWDVNPQLKKTIFWDKYHEAMQERKVVEFEGFYEPREIWFLIKVYPSDDGLTIFYNNITERKKADEQISAERLLSESLINSLPGIFYLFDKSGKFLRWNKNFEIVSGYNKEEISTMHPLDFYDTEEKRSIDTKIRSVFEKKGNEEIETFFFTKSRQKIPYYFNGYHVAFNNKEYVIGVGLDITIRKKIEKELKESEEKYRLLFHNSPISTWMLSHPDYKIIDVNDAAVNKYGYSRQEFLSMHARDILSEKQLEIFRASTDSETAFAGKWRHPKKNGDVLIAEVISHDLTYGKERVRVVLANDITDRERAENELRESQTELRKLYTYLQHIREEERTGIAREIHDELGQQLTGLKMDSYWIQKKLSGENEAVIKKISDMITLIDETIQTVRRISSDLRPGILDDLGLVAALEWQSQEFERRTGIQTEFHSAPDNFNPQKNVATNIFRVFQEALTNVARHANATRIQAFLEEHEGFIHLSIRDNGQGFNEEEIKTKNSLGLLGMRERALLFKGELLVESSAKGGTHITLKIPLEHTNNPNL